MAVALSLSLRPRSLPSCFCRLLPPPQTNCKTEWEVDLPGAVFKAYYVKIHTFKHLSWKKKPESDGKSATLNTVLPLHLWGPQHRLCSATSTCWTQPRPNLDPASTKDNSSQSGDKLRPLTQWLTNVWGQWTWVPSGRYYSKVASFRQAITAVKITSGQGSLLRLSFDLWHQNIAGDCWTDAIPHSQASLFSQPTSPLRNSHPVAAKKEKGVDSHSQVDQLVSWRRAGVLGRQGPGGLPREPEIPVCHNPEGIGSQRWQGRRLQSFKTLCGSESEVVEKKKQRKATLTSKQADKPGLSTLLQETLRLFLLGPRQA